MEDIIEDDSQDSLDMNLNIQNEKEQKDSIDAIPWPTILISVFGGILIVYTAVAPDILNNKRVFGIVMIGLWTLLWALLLWVLWRDKYYAISWWMLLVPVTVILLFFILVIIMNLGSQ